MLSRNEALPREVHERIAEGDKSAEEHNDVEVGARRAHVAHELASRRHSAVGSAE
jgi:hypothetical protein